MATEVESTAPTAPAKPITPARFRRVMDNYLAETTVKAAVGESAKSADRLREEILAHANELAGPAPTTIERTLAETAAICWFALRVAEADYERPNGLTIRQSEWHQRKIDHCHRRYLATLRTLAQVRKLGLPTLQVNIGANQVNVG